MRRLVRHLSWALLTAALAGCGTEQRGKVVFPPGGLALDSTGRRDRSLLNDTLIRIRTVGGASDEDTTLVNPYLMAMDADQVYLMEMDGRILCYDTVGQLRWVQGKEGGGPGEFRGPRDIKVGPDGRVWIVDPPSGRITVLKRTSGKVDTMMSLGVGHTEVLAPLGQRYAVFPPDGGADIEYFTSKGQKLGSDSLPWSGYHQLESLSRQLKAGVDRSSGHWAVGFIYGNGWFAYDSAGKASNRRYYVEPTAFPPVIKQVRDGALITSLVRTPFAAIDIQVVHDTVFVLFDGKEPNRRRKVDLYDWATGKYHGSFVLPETADNFGISGNLVVTYLSTPVPRLTYYRREKKAARQ